MLLAGTAEETDVIGSVMPFQTKGLSVVLPVTPQLSESIAA